MINNRFKQFINSKFFISLISLLLVLLVIFLLNKVSFLFGPIKTFLNVITLPLILGLILYYITKPIQIFYQKRDISKNASIWLTIVTVIAILGIIIIWIYPILVDQVVALYTEFPKYYDVLSSKLYDFLESHQFSQYRNSFDQIVESISANMDSYISNFITTTINSLGSTLSALVNITLGIITAPILYYYLLKDDYKIPQMILSIVPTRKRYRVVKLLSDINKVFELYIRGQLTVALAVAMMFSIGYTIIGLPYGMALATIAGFLNVIPYLGSFIAIIPALIIAAVHSPFMIVKVIIVAVIEQTLEGRIISPKILGDNLEIHPAVILIVLLTAGQLFGVTGVIIGVPMYAVLKVLVTFLFDYIKEKTQLYD